MRPGSPGAGLARRGPVDLPPPSLELLPASAQGPGALQACVVPQPRALGPIPLLSAEQVRGSPGRGALEPTQPSASPPRSLRPPPRGASPGGCPPSHGASTHTVQVPGLLPEDHRSQDVRSRGPGLHLPQLHHHRPREAGHRPGQHREAPFPARGWGCGVEGRGRPPTTCACRSASSSACPTTSSWRSSWQR